MPFFEENPLEKLAMQANTAEAELDLRGLPHATAMARVEQWLSDEHDRTATWLVRFDAAGEDGEETLFLPLGRRLLTARRAGRLASCLPASDAAGYYVTFTAASRP